jgi:hypothetical protein
MKIVNRDEHDRPLRESDSPWLGTGSLVFRPRAIQAMESLLLSHGELLPLACESADLFVFNPTHVLDALDEQASAITRFPSSGRIMSIDKHVFRRDVIGDLQIFKLQGLRGSATYVRERFVEQWNAAGLRGLTFPLAWEG